MNVKMYPYIVLLCLLIWSPFAFSSTDPVATIAIDSVYVIENATHKALDLLDKQFPTAISQELVTAPEFTYERIRSEYPVNGKILEDRQRVAAMFADIQTQGRWVDSFSNEDIQTLPVGIKYNNEESGTGFELGLMHAKVNTQYIEFTAFARLTLQQTDDTGKRIQLFFGANNVKISHKGGIVGDANLVLMGDVNIPYDNGAWMLSFRGGFDYRTGVTHNLTYASIDCDGLKEIGVQGAVQFSRDKLLPVKPTGELEPETRQYQGADGKSITIPNRVTGYFGMVVSDWNDMIAEISLSPFVLTKSKD